MGERETNQNDSHNKPYQICMTNQLINPGSLC